MLLPLFIGASIAFTGLDAIPPADISRAAGDDASVRAEISRISSCLHDQEQTSECVDEDGCTLPNPTACANVLATAWRAYMRRYLALLSADTEVARAVRTSQKLWEAHARADCVVDATIWDVRKVPYRGLYAERCTADRTQARALALRGYVIDLYGDADIQGGEPYPGISPFSSVRR